MKEAVRKGLENVAIVIGGGVMLGIVMGGVFSVPVMMITRERDPWLTLLLMGVMGCAIFGLGMAIGVPWWWLGILWVVAIGLLLWVRADYGSLGHSVERFGMVYAPMLFITLMLGPLAKPKKEGGAAKKGVGVEMQVPSRSDGMVPGDR
ncbi:hypothetical protein [Luteolibacter soli]|uniref:SxtJ n=1 Tax=Luteolibacter soli TaxID=3135280 RepID=A0ABU9AV86_9BACT